VFVFVFTACHRVRDATALMLDGTCCSNPRVAPVGPRIQKAQVRSGNSGGVMSSRRAHALVTRSVSSGFRSVVFQSTYVSRHVCAGFATHTNGGGFGVRRVGVKPTRAPSFATAAFGDADASDSGPDSSSPSSSSSSSSVSFGDLATIHPKVQLALARLGFHAPTFIQTQALPLITAGGDVVVAAETGSGKTLAYLVPIFSSLLWNGHGVDGDVNGVSSDAEGKNNQRGKVGALILAPNAVLVNQVAQVANLLVGENGEPLLKVAALTPDKALPIRFTPDIIVATPARAVEDVCRFSEGAWRRGGFSKHVPYIRHVVFDEADQLLSGGYLKPVRGIFDVLYREEKLAALGLTVEQSDDSNDESSQTDNTAQGGWSADAGRTPDSPAYEKDWRDDHKEDVAKLKKQISKQGQGPALGGKGLVGLGAGREFRRQYVFAAATVMSNGKKTPGAMIKYGFPDASWITGERLHRAVATVTQSWVAVTDGSRADALGVALGLGVDGNSSKSRKTMVFVNSGAACDDVTFELKRQGFKAAAFSADVSPEDRQHVLAKFKTNEGAYFPITTFRLPDYSPCLTSTH
jgi:superfamily II DNA/RNA helicase